MREDGYVKEIEKLRYEARNARKTYTQAFKNTDTAMGGTVGAGLVGKLNLPGANRAYQPGMYKPTSTDADMAVSERSFTGSRFGTMKEVSASVDLANPKFAEAFKGKYGMPTMSMGIDSFPSQAGFNLETSMQSAKKMPTPTSVTKSDSDEEEQH